jgi:hypothetical protein
MDGAEDGADISAFCVLMNSPSAPSGQRQPIVTANIPVNRMARRLEGNKWLEGRSGSAWRRCGRSQSVGLPSVASL